MTLVTAGREDRYWPFDLQVSNASFRVLSIHLHCLETLKHKNLHNNPSTGSYDMPVSINSQQITNQLILTQIRRKPWLVHRCTFRTFTYKFPHGAFVQKSISGEKTKTSSVNTNNYCT